MAMARLDIRLNEDSSKVIAQYECVTVENDRFDQFIEACEQAKMPNRALLEAAAFTKESGFK